METEKNGVQADQSHSTPNILTQVTQQSQVSATITQQGTQSQATASRKRDKAFANCKVLAVGRSTYTLAAKFYIEQIVNQDVQALKNNVMSLPKSLYHALLICHDKDEQNDGVWKSALEKKHFHLIIRTSDSKKAFRVSTMLKQLGIEFRQGLDDILLLNGALETVGSFPAYATYLTHDTKQAIADGKMRYDLDEIVSNLTKDEIIQVRDGYTRLCTNNKPTTQDMAELDESAFKLGCSLGNFDEWYNSLDFSIRSHAKMKTVRESYERGVNKCVTERMEVLRVCIFIQGKPNTGKTYTAKKVLEGKRIYTVSGGGSGKFDNLRADHQAIVIDDDSCYNILNMSDNYVCRAYRRNSRNPVWSGEYLVITSNLRFDEYLESCGLKIRDLQGNLTRHYDAMFSRFFVCRVVTENGVNRLSLGHASNRGTREQKMKRREMFLEFQRKFDEIAKDYEHEQNDVDFSDIEEDFSVELGLKVTKAELKKEYETFECLSNETLGYTLMSYNEWIYHGCPNTVDDKGLWSRNPFIT